MSWDVAIVKIRGGFRPIAEVEPADYVPLGELQAVQSAILTAFPSAQWSDPTWAVYCGKGFEFEFALEGVESANTVVVHVHGTGDPIPSLLKLTESNAWLAVDCSTGEFVNPKNPSYEGWEGFKALLASGESASEG
jgi:hypothetical protein